MTDETKLEKWQRAIQEKGSVQKAAKVMGVGFHQYYRLKKQLGKKRKAPPPVSQPQATPVSDVYFNVTLRLNASKSIRVIQALAAD